jgi:two-component system cell cycle response regulator DivK
VRHSTLAMPDRKRVLVAEDDDVNFELVEVVLKPLKVTVMRASTGKQAIEIATISRPDLILMDIRLPIVDGLEAVRRLRANSATHAIPIVALTASAMVGDSVRALEAGCNAYLSKPVSVRELLEVARRFLAESDVQSHGK